MMSAPITRVAITAIRRAHQLRHTSLTAAISTKTSSLSTLALTNSSSSSDGVRSVWSSSATSSSSFNVNRFDVSEPSNIKLSVANVLVNMSGDGALIATNYTQNTLSDASEGGDVVTSGISSLMETTASQLEELSIWLISTLKRRKKMMNKHKLRKRRKKLRLKSKK